MNESMLAEIGREHLRSLCRAVEELVCSYLRVGYNEDGEVVPAERRATLAEALTIVSEHLLAVREEIEEAEDAATHRSVPQGATDQREG